MQPRSAATHTSLHTFLKKHRDPLLAVLSVIPHPATPRTCSVCKCRGKSAGLHCPSHRDICTVRLHKQARIISSTPTHPGHASPPCLWKEILASSIRNYETNSFIPQAAGAVAPCPPAPPNSFQPRTDSQLIPNTHTLPAHTHNHVDVSCLTLLLNKLCPFFPWIFLFLLFRVCFYCVTF